MTFEPVEDVLGWLDKYKSVTCKRGPGSLCEPACTRSCVRRFALLAGRGDNG